MIQSQIILTVEAHRLTSLRISSPEFPNISVGDITWLNGLPRACSSVSCPLRVWTGVSTLEESEWDTGD